MNGRIVGAGVLAGLVVFVWGAISHMVLPLGEMGVSPLPAAEAVQPVLNSSVPQGGLYYFPWEEDPAKQEEAMRANARGILVLTPTTQPFSFPRLLAVEGATNIAGGILAAFLFAAAGLAGASIGSKLAFGATLGGFASLAIDFSYWNWYGFPTNYLAAQLADAIIAWSLASLVIGLVLRKR